MYQKKGCSTFAYFSVTATGELTATTVTATTGKIGILTVTQGEKALSLKLTATQMAKNTLGEGTSIDYYATKDDTPKIQNPGQKDVLEDAYSTLATVALSGADEGTKYHCQGKYTISAEIKTSLDGSADDIKEQVKAEDGKLYLKTTGGNGVTVSIKNDQDGKPQTEVEGVESIDHDIQSLLSSDKDFWVTYDFTATGSDINGKIDAAFKMSNTNTDQNYLADKKITVTLTPDTGAGKLTCEIQKDAE